MRRLDFLRRLRDEKRLGLVEPSGEIAASYIIKSSNALHAASIIVLRVVFCEPALSKIISEVKSKRIDVQYYVDFKASAVDARMLLDEAQKFAVKVRVVIEEMNSGKIKDARVSFSDLIGQNN